MELINMGRRDLPLILEHLSNIELYFFPELCEQSTVFTLTGDEVHHAMDVMRNEIGGIIFATDGAGNLYRCEIVNREKKSLTVNTQIVENRKDEFPDIYICIPNLKSADRLEFALEKLVEMGYHNFIIFKSSRSIHKNKKLNIDRLDKIAISAMKQSLNLWKPQIIVDDSLTKVETHNYGANVFYLDISGDCGLEIVHEAVKQNSSINKYLVFGPEGGLSDEDLKNFPNKQGIRLTETRLRSETAIVYAGSVLSNYLIKSRLQ